MPNLDLYKKMHYGAKTSGQAHKIQSDNVLESTWYNDIAAKIGFLYDQYHDDEFELSEDLHPYNSRTKIPVEIKHYEIEYNSLAKDEIAHHIMFKPSYEPNVPYYEDKFAKPLGAIFPIGLYLDLPDESGIYRRWLVVGEYREYSNQFLSYLVLPCDHKLQWVYNNQKYESWCVLRSQNSYNSGLWTDYKETAPENQKIVWMPFNDKTQTIFYDQRVVVSQVRETPVVWRVSKVEDMNVKGIARYTMAQDRWDSHRDYIEHDEEGNVIGMWASWFDYDVEPDKPDHPETNITCEISYRGVQNNQFRIKGNPRIFDVKFFRDDQQIEYQGGTWSFIMDGKPCDDLFTIEHHENDADKIKFIGSDDYKGQTVTLTFTSINNVSDSIEMNIVGN